MQVLYLGRASRTKETLPDFREKCRVARHSRVFCWLTGSQRTPGIWGVTEKMVLYLKKVREILKKFVRVQVKHVPRTENSRADALAKLATASQEDLGKLISVEHLPEPSVSIDNGEVSPVMSEPSWMDPIWDYLVDGTLPSDPKEASKLRGRSARFTVHRGALYK